jgi:phospholipase C
MIERSEMIGQAIERGEREPMDPEALSAAWRRYLAMLPPVTESQAEAAAAGVRASIDADIREGSLPAGDWLIVPIPREEAIEGIEGWSGLPPTLNKEPLYGITTNGGEGLAT